MSCFLLLNVRPQAHCASYWTNFIYGTDVGHDLAVLCTEDKLPTFIFIFSCQDSQPRFTLVGVYSHYLLLVFFFI